MFANSNQSWIKKCSGMQKILWNSKKSRIIFFKNFKMFVNFLKILGFEKMSMNLKTKQRRKNSCAHNRRKPVGTFPKPDERFQKITQRFATVYDISSNGPAYTRLLVVRDNLQCAIFFFKDAREIYHSSPFTFYIIHCRAF